MKVTKMKKALLVMSLGMGLSGVVFNAHARPSYENCLDLVERCKAGELTFCRTVDNHCWVYDIFV